ncbi:quinone-dependent dihydroorotate dehydrogenase [Microvirgula aerodenitrificans]|uniref:quinone-dependent dihydroorotate dehydrogenase n=1 Tax=Microvirgula aerodenitrificans TaxID=57480 RepID=UPI00248D3C00|nr:quinone-dependent dihydroorotate dehydrogenase [Microvirgula aerodenitrificans]
MYQLVRPLLFRLDAEKAHHLALNSLRTLNNWGLDGFLNRPVADCPVDVMGMKFPNPVGLAAGLDKNGEYIDALAGMGFGFIEVGTVTPLPQPGNPRPRMFRLTEAEAIINRMGFNNLGVDNLVENVRRVRYRGILGINIGKNASTPNDRAIDDYLICLNKVYPHASYVTVNISSPNTRNLRDLQGGEQLNQLLNALHMRQLELADQHGRYVPLAIKIAPDLDTIAIREIADMLAFHRMDAVIATNTTVSRNGVLHLPGAAETGGLSGAPLVGKSTEVITELATALASRLPIIGVGGILRGDQGWEKLQAGASLLQLYSGLIYKGQSLVGDTADACRYYFDQNPTRRVFQRVVSQAAEPEAEDTAPRMESMDIPDFNAGQTGDGNVEEAASDAGTPATTGETPAADAGAPQPVATPPAVPPAAPASQPSGNHSRLV